MLAEPMLTMVRLEVPLLSLTPVTLAPTFVMVARPVPPPLLVIVPALLTVRIVVAAVVVPSVMVTLPVPMIPAPLVIFVVPVHWPQR